MTVISIDIDSGLLLDVLLVAIVSIALYAAFKLRRFPMDMADNIAYGLGQFTKQTDKGEALAHLSSVIQDAFDGNYLRLAELMGNPIAMKAWQQVQPMIAGGLQKSENGGLAYVD